MKHIGSRQLAAIALTVLMFTPYHVAPAPAQQDEPLLMVSPTQNSPDDPDHLRDMCLNPDDWPTGWQRATAFGNSIQFWAMWTNDSQVEECLENLDDAGIELFIDSGAIKEHCETAEECWEGTLPTLERLEGLGASNFTLTLDEPLTAAYDHLNPSQNFAYAVAQTGEWIELARDEFPNATIAVYEAFPRHSWPVLRDFFEDVNDEAIDHTGWGIQYALLDHDWNQGGSLSHVYNIQQAVHGEGMGFAVVFWRADPSDTWTEGLEYQGDLYQNWRSAGLDPDLYIINNWTGEPDDSLAEWDGGSFTNSVRDFVHRFLPVASLEPGEQLDPGEDVESPDERFRLVYQNDGNLVLYRIGVGALWSSQTSSESTGYAVMQSDGNLVVRDASETAVWASGTHGNSNAILAVQSDGNLVIYSNYENEVLWASDTDCC